MATDMHPQRLERKDHGQEEHGDPDKVVAQLCGSR